jgi:hypothetical protein
MIEHSGNPAPDQELPRPERPESPTRPDHGLPGDRPDRPGDGGPKPTHPIVEPEPSRPEPKR